MGDAELTDSCHLELHLGDGSCWVKTLGASLGALNSQQIEFLCRSAE